MFKSCGKCRDGYVFKTGPYGQPVAQKCECLKKYQQSIQDKIYLEPSGIDSFDWKYDISQYQGQDANHNIPKIKNYVRMFKEKFHRVHLYLWSHENSTQKTTVAKWIGVEIGRQKRTVRFVLMDDLLKALTDTFDADQKARVKEFMNVDCLIIDDSFDPKKVTLYRSGYQFSFIDSFLRKRMEHTRKATIFTSNIAPNEIGEIYTVDLERMVRRNIVEDFHFTDVIEEGSLLEAIDLETFWEL